MTGNSQIHAFAAMHAGDVLRSYRYSPGDLGPSEIEIAITHYGICHSGLHLIDNDWGVSAFPLVRCGRAHDFSSTVLVHES